MVFGDPGRYPASLGWHVALQVDVGTIADLRAYLERFSVPVVIDHMGRPRPGHADPATPGPRQLIELVGEGACFTKLSAPYRLSAAPPPWPDVTPLARALLDANPAACLWASNWPHAHVETPVRVADVFQALDDACPPGEAREIVMVRTPRALFGKE